jgi:membrane fusion protein (multidrug efflux system)
MYVNVKVTTGLVNRTITLPRTTITFNSFGSSVYRIESNGQDEKGKPKFSAKQSLVSTGDTRGDQVAILTGVKEGETIVTSGQIKLRNGSPVTIDNSVHPSNDAMPQLDDQ